MANKTLNAAKKAKDDEFYTQMADVERELQHYWPHFRGRTVLCNCDDPYESNFFKYFALHFNHLGLKKLICTCYDGSPVQGRELLLHFEGLDKAPRKMAYQVEITEVKDLNGDGAVDISDVRYLLQNNLNVLHTLRTGDFRSPECVALLKEADIVVTNPPFSLFREFLAQLMEYDKKFLIIGNLNAVKYKEVFPLIMQNEIWLGINNGAKIYLKADGSKHKMGNTGWFTNLMHKHRNEKLDLVRHYSKEEYPEYDSYPAIEVSNTVNIPCDYSGEMGVPISFLNKYDPEQFEIVGVLNHGCDNVYDLAKPILKGKELYTRILIRNKHPQI